MTSPITDINSPSHPYPPLRSPEVEIVSHRRSRTPPPQLRSPTPEWDDEGVQRWEGDTGYAHRSFSGYESLGVRGVKPQPVLAARPAADAEPSRSKSRSKDKTAAEVDVSEMPDYAGMSLKELQAKVKSYGFKSSTQHAQLVRVCTQVWQTMYPGQQSVNPSPSKSSSPDKRTPSTKSPRQHGDHKGRKPREPSPTLKKKAPPLHSSAMGTDEWDDLSREFHAMIVANDDLWTRVLRYEPVSFDEIVSLGHESGIKTKGWRNTLKVWLDDQSITYFTEEQTGSRQRYA